MEKYLPQIVLLFFLVYGLITAYYTNGEKIVTSFRGELICFVITIALLGWGGFFNGIFQILFGG